LLVLLGVGTAAIAAAVAVPGGPAGASTMTYTDNRHVMVYDFNTAEGSLGSSGDSNNGMNFLAFARTVSLSPHVPDLLAMQEVNTTSLTDPPHHTCAEFQNALQNTVPTNYTHDGFNPNYGYLQSSHPGGVCLVYRLRFQVVHWTVLHNVTGANCDSTSQYNADGSYHGPTPYNLIVKLKDTANTTPTYIDVAVVHLPFGTNRDCAETNIPAIEDQFTTNDAFLGVNARMILGDFNATALDTRPGVFPASYGYHVVPLVDPDAKAPDTPDCTYCHGPDGAVQRIDWAWVNSASFADNQLVPYDKARSVDQRPYSDHKGMMFTLDYDG
jgi:hypothetical protein